MKSPIEPGVYVNMPEDVYHNDPALGSSGVKQLLKNPQLYWFHSALNPDRQEKESTPAMKFGSAYHRLILEPEKFDYEIKKGVSGTKEPGKLGEGEYNTMLEMQKALCANEKHIALLSGGIPEVSIFFDHPSPVEGAPPIRCKVRTDCFSPHWFSDLKTSGDVSDKGLRYSFGDFGYDISGAMYSLAAKYLKEMIAAGYKMPPEFDEAFISDFCQHKEQIFAFIFQEKEPPYITRCWVMSPWITDIGLSKFHYGLNLYQQSRDLKTRWPSPYEQIEEITEDMLSPSIMYY